MNKQNHIEEFNNILENDGLLDIFSTVGSEEEINQDSIEVSSSKSLTVLLLASGLGGGTIAELISSMAAEKALNLLENYRYDQKSSEEIMLFLKKIFSTINDLILDYIDVSNIQGYATTLSIALIYKNSLYTAHIGESRIYVIRRGDRPILLSSDPSYSQKNSKNSQEPEESYFLGDEAYEDEYIFITHEDNLVHKEKLFVCSKNILENIPENKFDRDIDELKSIMDEKEALLSSTFLRYTHYERSIEKIKISAEDIYAEDEKVQIDWERYIPFLKKIALSLGIFLLLGSFYLIVKGLLSTETLPNNDKSKTEVPIEIKKEKVETIVSIPKIKEEPKIEDVLGEKLKLIQKKDSTVLHVGEEGIRITFKENRLISSKLGTFQISNKNPKEIHAYLNNIDSDLNGEFVHKLKKQTFSKSVSIKSKNNSVKINIKIKETCSYTQSSWGKNNGLDLFIFSCEEAF